MTDQDTRAAVVSALTTEHFVLQSAASATVTDAAARSSLYVLSLSSALIALGFASRSHEVLVPFVSAVLPAIFVLGVFTVVRLVDSALENIQCLEGIARIRRFYRTLSPDAAVYFAAEHGRWPEGHAPSLRLGAALAYLTTSASMIAFINSIVAGAGVMWLLNDRLGVERVVSFALGFAIGSRCWRCSSSISAGDSISRPPNTRRRPSTHAGRPSDTFHDNFTEPAAFTQDAVAATGL